jgi:hypothetical protein
MTEFHPSYRAIQAQSKRYMALFESRFQIFLAVSICLAFLVVQLYTLVPVSVLFLLWVLLVFCLATFLCSLVSFLVYCHACNIFATIDDHVENNSDTSFCTIRRESINIFCNAVRNGAFAFLLSWPFVANPIVERYVGQRSFLNDSLLTSV